MSLPSSVCLNRQCTAHRYSPEASEEELEYKPRPTQRSRRLQERSAGPQGNASLEPSPDRSRNAAAPRVRWNWRAGQSLDDTDGRAGSMSAPQRHGGKHGDGIEAAEVSPQRYLSPGHGLRRSQRGARGTNSPSPALEEHLGAGSSRSQREPRRAISSNPALERPGSLQGASRRAPYPALERPGSLRSASVRAPFRPPSLAPDHPSASANGSALANGSLHAHDFGVRSRSTRGQMRHDGGLLSEDEQIEEAIRQSLQSEEEQHCSEGPELTAPGPSPARTGRSGFRIKLRGVS